MQVEDREEPHYFEHLAPICFFLGIPLYTRHERMKALCDRVYPACDVRLISDDYQSLSKLLTEHDAFINAHYLRTPFEHMLKRICSPEEAKGKRFIYLPHGNSDKGIGNTWMWRYALEDIVLVYGDRMEAFLKQLDVYPYLHHLLHIGNPRKEYYKAFKPHFDQLIDEEVFSLFKKEQKTILYAPTWVDYEGKSSILAFSSLLKSVPKHWNLIVKLHPNLSNLNPLIVWKVKGAAEEIPNVQVVDHVHSIYPLIERCDAYLGDTSSVGYDFLSVDRPLYFLCDDTRYLHQAGRMIQKENWAAAFSVIDQYCQEDLQVLSKKRRALYQETFAKVSPKRMKDQIEHSLQKTVKQPIAPELAKFLVSTY